MTSTQLPLLPQLADTPTRLLLPDRTRRLGLAQVAAARAVLEAAARSRAEREQAEATARPTAAEHLEAMRQALRARATRAAA